MPPLAEEYATLRRDCGVGEAPPADRLVLVGPDRERLLNGLVTCDARGLAPGQGRLGFFTDLKGRILAEVAVLAGEESLVLALPGGRGAAIRAHVEKYLLAERVELRGPTAESALVVAGPLAAERLRDLWEGELPGTAWGHAAGRLGGSAAKIRAERAAAGLRYVVSPTAESAAAVREALVAAIRPVGAEALEAVRVEDGELRFGVDLDDDCFPQETGREDEAVNYEKGCYLGQEIVARIHYRGGVNRVPRGLLFVGDAPEPGATLSRDGREAGRATSVVASPALGRVVGLALVHRRAAEPGTLLAVGSSGEAEVAELPLVSSAG